MRPDICRWRPNRPRYGKLQMNATYAAIPPPSVWHWYILYISNLFSVRKFDSVIYLGRKKIDNKLRHRRLMRDAFFRFPHYFATVIWDFVRSDACDDIDISDFMHIECQISGRWIFGAIHSSFFFYYCFFARVNRILNSCADHWMGPMQIGI